MEESNKIRKAARKSLSGKWKEAFYINLVFCFIVVILALLQYYMQFNNIAYFIATLITFIVAIPLQYGLFASLYKLRNNEKVAYFDSIKLGLKNFKRAWSITARILLKILPILLFLFVAALIMSVGATIVAKSNIKIDSLSAFNVLDKNGKLGIILVLCGMLGYLIFTILLVPKLLLYAPTYIIGFNNNELNSKEVLLKSKKIMKGNRVDLFKLLISFIFWIIIAFIPYSILVDALNLPIIGLVVFVFCYALLLAYILMSIIEFYELKKEDK